MSLKRTLGVIGLSSLINFSALAVDNDLPTYNDDILGGGV